MQNIFIELLPPWIETGLQPAFYDKESGTVLQQVSRMWAKMIELGQAFNTFSEDTTTFVNQFVDDTNETVDEYIAKFVELHDYVHDYFDNLDVQEEINNKLDDMVEAGTLQEIITSYIQANVAWTFDTVADMKLATNLVNGSYARTLGYHTMNDGGGALYKITSTGTANEMDVIAVGSLYANIQLDKEITLENFGAYGDDNHDDSDIIQAVINYSVTEGLKIAVLPKVYKVTKTINIPNGTKMEGITPNYSFQSNWKSADIKAYFEDTDTTNTDPIFNISNDGKNVYSNFPSSTTNRTGIQIKNIRIYGQGAFCGVKIRGYDITLDNVSIERCKIGMHIYRAFVCYFTRVNIFFCEIGIYNVEGVGNTIYRDLYITYGSNILENTDVSSIVQNTFGTALRTDKICSVYLSHSTMTMEDCCLEATYYGIYLRNASRFQSTYLSVEAIPTGGAVFADYSNENPNYVRVDNLNLYNSELYGGKICQVAYRSQYYIHANIPKPANFADPTMSTRGVMKVTFTDWEYILPVDITNITGLDVTNNHTRFDDNGNIEVDFVVNDYTSQDSGLSSKLALGSLTGGYSDTGYIPMLGADYRLNTATMNFSKNSDGTLVNTPKKTRYCFKLKYVA